MLQRVDVGRQPIASYAPNADQLLLLIDGA